MLAFAIRYLIFLLIAKRTLPNSQVARVFSEESSRIDLAHLGPVRGRKRPAAQTSKPFVSILVACYNEIDVIDRLMKSFLALTYGAKNFEIIIVDDSNDGTFERLQKYSSVPNLKIFHRTSRDGWKGGALNLAIRHLNTKSKYSLIIDADHVVENDLLDKCVAIFARGRKLTSVQGFPIPSIGAQSSWVSRGVFFRWVRRNLVEFVAKEQMALPIQLTGSLFMIRSDVLREIEFSNDLTEDWELTLALYLQNRGFAYKKNSFPPILEFALRSSHRTYGLFQTAVKGK